MRRLRYLPFFRNNRALSYTVSAMLITGTTIVLVLIASIYAYQILEQQKGLSEFEVGKKSILAFDDALENVAWKLQASRSTRFTIEYGLLELTPNASSIGIAAKVGSSTWTLYNGTNGQIRYTISDKYTTFGDGYSSYILGNSSNILVGSTGSYGRALVKQDGSWVSILLDYRVRAMTTSVVDVGGKKVNYVDIWVIKLKMLVTQSWQYIHDFDLKAKCTSITTSTIGPKPVNGMSTATITTQLGSTTGWGVVPLDPTAGSEVVFNVVVSEVQVYV